MGRFYDNVIFDERLEGEADIAHADSWRKKILSGQWLSIKSQASGGMQHFKNAKSRFLSPGLVLFPLAAVMCCLHGSGRNHHHLGPEQP